MDRLLDTQSTYKHSPHSKSIYLKNFRTQANDSIEDEIEETDGRQDRIEKNKEK